MTDMNRTHSSIATSLILLCGIIASASALYAKPKSTAQSAMDACDRKLAADWTFCEGSKDSTTRRKCDENAEARWKRCYENAGWVFSVQGNPKMPARRPSSVNPGNTGGGSAGVEKDPRTGRPKAERIPMTPAASARRATPTPTPKKAWTPQGARQTGSHMR